MKNLSRTPPALSLMPSSRGRSYEESLFDCAAQRNSLYVVLALKGNLHARPAYHIVLPLRLGESVKNGPST